MKTAYEVLKETGVYPEDFISMASVGGVEKAMETYAKQQNFQLIEALKQAKEALLIATQDGVSWQRRLHSTVEAIETINKLGI